MICTSSSPVRKSACVRRSRSSGTPRSCNWRSCRRNRHREPAEPDGWQVRRQGRHGHGRASSAKNFLRFHSITSLFLRQNPCARTPLMNRIIATPALACLLLAMLTAGSRAADAASETPVFKDKNLEKAVRKFVFEKRDNDKPIVEADVVNLSTIQGVGMAITDLSGLEKCVNLASLDLSKNKVKSLAPLKGLTKLQYLNLADNLVDDIKIGRA